MIARLPALLASFIFGFSALLAAPLVHAINNSQYSVQVSAVAQKSPPQIRLTWAADPGATGYTVYRKAPGATAWGAPLATLPAAAGGYTDSQVVVGASYEYQVVKAGYEARSGTRYTGYGYLYSGIEAPLIENRGKIILVVDNTHAAALANELARLEQDLTGDGWIVLRRDVSRAMSAAQVKAVIKTAYTSDPVNVKAVFLFGHVAVPYSGNTAFDGHVDFHQGAWPADAYYGDMDGVWTDSTVYATNLPRAETRNVPGDGKFDQSYLPSDLELQVGRVDLYNMPAFLPKTELDLLRQYLNKDHKFRHNAAPFDSVARRALIDENFGTYAGAAMAANGWRNFAAFFGAGNIQSNTTNAAIDWFPVLSANSYLWGYGNGPGHYQGSKGVGTTAPNYDPKFGAYNNFALRDTKVVFTMLFGSAFGDWDVVNNFLRAPLATPSYGLTSSWSGFPHWFYQHMALGQNIGYSARLSQNNRDLYKNQSNPHARGVHAALMGDPTLRMHPVTPIANLTSTVTTQGVTLSWTASTDSVIGYHIYRAADAAGPFQRLTGAPVTTTRYTDSSATSGKYTYMVRAIKLETSASGTYFNSSQGVFLTVDVGRVTPPAPPPPPPAPAVTTLQFSRAAFGVGENKGLAWITVTRTGSASGAVSVNYATGNGTALAGADYRAASGVIRFADGDTLPKRFAIPIINDRVRERAETINLSLSNPSANAALGAQRTAALTIYAND
ncbi:MAG: Calx-beta domain-containing protein [Pseudomonadota bacterium]